MIDNMGIFQAIVLGFIQGLTEFLPISSSGHLILIPKLFNWPDQGLAFDAIIHLATALAIIIILRKDIIKVIKGFNFKSKQEGARENNKILKLIILAIIPAGLIGFWFENFIENVFRSTLVVGISLIVWAVGLYLAELYTKKNKSRYTDLKDLNWKQSLVIGFMQIIAFIPGTSRSGITIMGGLFSKLDRQLAVKFSFLIGLPLILAAGGLKLLEVLNSGVLSGQEIVLIIGFMSSLAFGLLAIKLLLWLAEKANFKVFVVYRIVLGIVILIVL